MIWELTRLKFSILTLQLTSKYFTCFKSNLLKILVLKYLKFTYQSEIKICCIYIFYLGSKIVIFMKFCLIFKLLLCWKLIHDLDIYIRLFLLLLTFLNRCILYAYMHFKYNIQHAVGYRNFTSTYKMIQK